MARPPDALRIPVRPELRRLDPGAGDRSPLAPARFSAIWNAESVSLVCLIVVDLEGRPFLEDFTSDRPLGATGPVPAELLELVADPDLPKVAVAAATWPAPGSGTERHLDGATPREAHDVERAAELYTGALEQGLRGPTNYVAEALGVSRSTASRLIRLARERGVLPAADRPRKAGRR